ncbi:efflux RND transporter permease subunit, partial [Rhizobium ruizarguesonis]
SALVRCVFAVMVMLCELFCSVPTVCWLLAAAIAEQFRSLVIANPNGAPIQLGDIADVQDSVENQYNGSWYDGQRGIILDIQRQPDANT